MSRHFWREAALLAAAVLALACSNAPAGTSGGSADLGSPSADVVAPADAAATSDVAPSDVQGQADAADASEAPDVAAEVAAPETADAAETAQIPDVPDETIEADAGAPDAAEPPDVGGDLSDVGVADVGAEIADTTPTPDAPDTQETVAAPYVPTAAAFSAALAASDSEALDQFLAAYDMPICDGSTCLFVTKAAPTQAVDLMGSWNGWSAGTAMAAVPFRPEVKFATVSVGAFTAPLEYKLKSGDAWWLDPSCPYFLFGGFGPNSAVYPKGSGRLRRLGPVHSSELGNDRMLYVYISGPYFDDPSLHLPVLYMQDGFNVFTNPQAAFGSWDVEVTANALVASGEVAPLIVVGIDTNDRMSEYVYAPLPYDKTVYPPKLDPYGAFLVGTVKPLVDKTLRTLPDRDHTGIAGSSLGGLSALYLAWKHHAVFGFVASLSGSFWFGEPTGEAGSGTEPAATLGEIITANAEGVPAGGLRVYMDSGDSDFDGGVSYEADSWVYSDWTRNALIAAGWTNRTEWDTDGNLSTPPKNLSYATPVASVPALPFSATVPPSYTGWKAYLGPTANLLSLVGKGHVHNEGAWKQRMAAVLRFLLPGPKLL